MTETWEDMKARHARERAEWKQAASYQQAANNEHARTLVKITAAVAEKHNMTPAQMRGPQRIPEYCAARFEAWKLAREMGYSLPSIARYFNRDHSTIIHGLRRVQQ